MAFCMLCDLKTLGPELGPFICKECREKYITKEG